jgi:hypothetical protein
MNENWATGGPVEPSADLRTAAKELRGMFLALTAEGFTEPQALVIVGQILSAHGKQ